MTTATPEATQPAAPRPRPRPPTYAEVEAEALQNVRGAIDTKSAQEHVEATVDFFAKRATAHMSPAEMRRRAGGQP